MALFVCFSNNENEIEELSELFQSCPDECLLGCLEEAGYEPDSNEAQAKAQAEADAKADDDAKALAEKAKAEAKLQAKIDRINKELNELYEVTDKAKAKLQSILANPELIKAKNKLKEAEAKLQEAEDKDSDEDEDEINKLYENVNAALSRVDVLMEGYYHTEEYLSYVLINISEKEELRRTFSIELFKLKALVSFFEIMEGLEELSIELEKLNA